MKALSIQQPWAWAILCAGKDIENRTWKVSYRGPILVHTGKNYDAEGHYYIEDELHISVPDILPLGGIVGQVDIIDCVKQSVSRWFMGPVGFVLANPKPLSFISYKGRLGLFDIPYHKGGIVSKDGMKNAMLKGNEY